MITALIGVFIGIDVSDRTTSTTRYAPARPSTPPTVASTPDSVTNCMRMCFLRAPRERRTPISRVLSVTLASMMFMITIPPTTRNTLTIPIAADASVPVKSCHSAMIESEPRMAKLSSAL